MPPEPKSREPEPTGLPSNALPDAPAPSQAAADFSANVSLVLDALGRMEATHRADRQTLERLRGTLGAVVETIGRAKAALAAGHDAAAALDELEHLADTMIETAGGAAASTPPKSTEAEHVPTVTAVVSQLAVSTADRDAPVIDAAQDAAVSELKAMLEAMTTTALPPEPAARPETVPEPAGPDEAAPLLPEPAAIAETAVPPGLIETVNESAPEAASPEAGPLEELPLETISLEASALETTSFEACPLDASSFDATSLEASSFEAYARPASPGATALPPVPAPVPVPAFQEDELLASFARLNAVPILPPEEGAAVIFEQPKPEPPAAPTLVTPGFALPLPEPEIAASAEPDIALAAETETADTDIASPEPAAKAAFMPLAEFEPSEQPMANASPVLPETGSDSASALSEAATVATLPEAEFDPDIFLFGAETKPDPALFGDDPEPDLDAFLLEPLPIAPPRLAAAPLPQPEFAHAAAETPHAVATELASIAAASDETVPVEIVPVVEPVKPAANRAHDPLHALNAMSEWEKIALFS